jgi:hypothetical protein
MSYLCVVTERGCIVEGPRWQTPSLRSRGASVSIQAAAMRFDSYGEAPFRR